MNASEIQSIDRSTRPARHLEIGPGAHPLPDYESLDWGAGSQADHHARWGAERLPFDDDTFDDVFASHVLEHVPWNRTQAALTEVLRILKPGGRFEVWVPDFEYIVDCYRKHVCGDAWRRENSEGNPMKWVNGRVFTYGPGPENWHHACFDAAYLRQCLAQAGFTELERMAKRRQGVSHGPIDLGVTGFKPVVRGSERGE